MLRTISNNKETPACHHDLQQMMELFCAYDSRRLQLYQSRGDSGRIAIRNFGQSIALQFSEVDYFNRIYHCDENTLALLPVIGAMYEGHPFPVELIGAAGFDLKDHAALLSSHGYVPGTTYARMSKKLESYQVGTPSPGIDIRPPLPCEQERVLDIYLRGFGAAVQNDAAAKANMRLLFTDPAIEFWVALIDQQPVAIGMLFEQQGLAYFCGGATLPEFRNHGCHQALIERRFQEARQRGCKEVVSWAIAGGASHKNMVAQGFETVQVDQAWQFGNVANDG